MALKDRSIVWKILSSLLAIGVVYLVGNNYPISHLLFYNKEYKSNLIVEPFILKEEQICNILTNNLSEQLINEELQNEQLYLVVCIRNNGNLAAWGELTFIVNYQNIINLSIPHIGTNKGKIYKFVVPYVGGVRSEKKEIPLISYEWKRLFTK